jgi:hypothetical protein
MMSLLRLNPYFETHGKKWMLDIGLSATVDAFSGSKSAKFYFHPQLNAQFDVYEALLFLMLV